MSYADREQSTQGRLALASVALRYLDASCGHGEWFRIGAAIHTFTGGSPEGLQIFDEWSATSFKYPGRRTLERQWTYYGRNGGRRVTLGTLRRYLQEAGISWAAVTAEAQGNAGGWL